MYVARYTCFHDTAEVPARQRSSVAVGISFIEDDATGDLKEGGVLLMVTVWQEVLIFF